MGTARAQKAQIDPAKIRAVMQRIDQLEISKATEPLLDRKIRQNNTRRFVDPVGYQAGQASNLSSLLAKSDQSIAAEDQRGSIGTQRSMDEAATANASKIDQMGRDTAFANILGAGSSAIFSGVKERFKK